MKHYKKIHRAISGAFSLIELLTAMTILSVLMLLMTALLDQVQQAWRFGENSISQFREARVAFDLVAKNLSQATMNTYLDYKYDDLQNVESYEKRSELHFYSEKAEVIEDALGLSGKTSGHAVFFQAPLGYSVRFRNLGNLFNGRGYLVVYDDDAEFRPSFVTASRKRFRLMEFRPPAEANQVFADAIDEVENDLDQNFKDWWNQGMGIGEGGFSDHLNPLAENIVLLLVAPTDSIDAQQNDRYNVDNDLAPNYIFNSNQDGKQGKQVPPLVRITMVAIDESTAVALEDRFNGSKPDIIPKDLFQKVSDYTEDLGELVQYFNDYEDVNINYRVFSTVVMLRAAKWVSAIPDDEN